MGATADGRARVGGEWTAPGPADSRTARCLERPRATELEEQIDDQISRNAEEMGNADLLEISDEVIPQFHLEFHADQNNAPANLGQRSAFAATPRMGSSRF